MEARHHPRCKDGSLDMRYRDNRGLNKYGYESSEAQGLKELTEAA